MKLLRTLGLAAAAAIGTLTLTTTDAQAAGCPRGSKPVILVHGRGLTATTPPFDKLVGRLQKNGYCVYRDFKWGKEGAYYGHGHLKDGAAQLRTKVDRVLANTGAKKVALVAHSAGQGVADYYLQKLGGDKKVYSDISFAGLHHPYAYFAIPNIIDAEIYIPALSILGPIVDVARFLVSLIPNMAVANSSFVADLFNDVYWKNLQGNEPANPVVLPTFGNGTPTIYTRKNDGAAGVCYTNLTAPADPLVGRVTGNQFGNKGEYRNLRVNVGGDLSGNAHTNILFTNAALDLMIAGLSRGQSDCGGGNNDSGPVNGH